MNCQLQLISLPNDTILVWSNLKAFADDKIKLAKMMTFVFDRVGNIEEKEKTLVITIFSLLAIFFTAVSVRVFQNLDCVVELTVACMTGFVP